jgi:hypothetical protein
MAKSVKIREEQEPMSRQVRRALEREKKIPAPWHVVYVEPKTGVKGTPGGGEGAEHGYRYDVIGHLRCGRHKTKDGYRETIEWVSDHQRGLKHELYIPKTYQVEGNRKIEPSVLRNYLKRD